jgi:hypothetical protein
MEYFSFDFIVYLWSVIGDYMIAAMLGAVVSSGEIVARYRDEPWDTLRSVPALFYMLINALASMAALTIVRILVPVESTGALTIGDIHFKQTNLMQVIAAGLGAMMIFRSAFFTLRVNNQDVPVGAASFLQVMLDAVDREVDRRRATLRANRVHRIMGQIAFDKALAALPSYSVALMQNLPPEDRQKLFDALKSLSTSTELNPQVKSQILGLLVMNYLGEEVLQASVDALKAEIQNPLAPGQILPEPPAKPANPLEKIIGRLRGESPAENLPAPVPSSDASSAASAAAPASVSEILAAPAALPSTPVDINRVLSRVRENTSATEAPATPANPQPEPENDPPAILLADTPVS